MKKLILCFALAPLCLLSFSQNFKPATVVTVDGKSMEGEINDKNWKKNPSQIQFRDHAASSTSTYRTYTAKELKSFTVGGDNYISAIVDVDYFEDNAGDLTIESNILVRRDTVLLRALVTGTKSLYHYYDATDHFYIKKDDGFELLRHKKYISYNNNDHRVYLYNREFVMQLNQYLPGCESLDPGSDKMKYAADNLTNIFKRYYACKSETPVFLQAVESEKIELGVLAGASNTNFKINSTSGNNSWFLMSRSNFSTSVNFAGGIFVDVVFPRQRQKVSLNNELMYSSYETSGSYKFTQATTGYDEYIYDFAYSYVKMNNMLRYKFLINKSAIFINGGLSTGVLLKEHSKLTKIRKADNVSFEDKAFVVNERKFEIGFLAGAGFRKNRASIEVRAERGGGPLSELETVARVYRYYALIGYRIK